ncbi:flagellar FliJ protein [Lachnospiraceae bacterium PF1-21]|uniref:flagellar export protein FliJ n=1 Tax=Ohessyouella blattaphilus TaxID=2949333 RepID=UPI003E2A2E12
MKKFSFSLEKVLRFKSQIERNLRNEHANILHEIIRQEESIKRLEEKYQETSKEFEEVKRSGTTINNLRAYEDYCKTLRQSIALEEYLLTLLRQKEEKKREEVVVAKQETASFDLLKGKRLTEYTETLKKNEERELEEFIASTMHQKKGA